MLSLLLLEMGKLRDVCEEIWHVLTKDGQCGQFLDNYLNIPSVSCDATSIDTTICPCVTRPRQNFNSSETGVWRLVSGVTEKDADPWIVSGKTHKGGAKSVSECSSQQPVANSQQPTADRLQTADKL